MRLVCRECAHEVRLGTLGRCPHCGGILSLVYPPQALARLKTNASGIGLDRFRAVLPTGWDIPSLGEGDTPLIPSRRIGPALRTARLYFKHEGRNPTGSFKDRGAALAVAPAAESVARIADGFLGQPRFSALGLLRGGGAGLPHPA